MYHIILIAFNYKKNIRMTQKIRETHDSIKIARSFIFLHNCFLLQNLTWYQTRTIRRNRNSNKIVLSGSRVFRATALSKAAVLDQRLLS
jgi:hypothetical protein